MTAPRTVIMIGAARSGTKILRDALAEATGSGRVPYDIGYVWRMGNEGKPDDVITAAEVTPRARRFITRFVNKYAAGDPPVVIEKTVGNTLRVPAVAALFPEAVFVHILRDGVDVIESTRRQWQAPTDVAYLRDKLRHFPVRLAPTYGVKYVRSLAHRRSSERIGSWGPRYAGIDDDLAVDDLLVVCARQWRESVQSSLAGLAELEQPVITVRYEELAHRPAEVLAETARAAGLGVDPAGLERAAARIVPDRTGSGRRHLSPEELRAVDAEVGDLLDQLGYPRPDVLR